ncbi:nucleotidyltransferase domain-containing protein [Vibrio hyugaensis]|uniref:nucleotidyltransferase domain-containing protein n=1 Tax=Vibrio hyugaensis TaxID=1534743 RepID=UPI000CE3B049|nr:nucleotidyltransferase domain-containing protein [Vibrio hyugaensis]
MHEPDRGLDAQGFIRNVCSPENIQAEFQPVIDAVVAELLKYLPEQIDGIYLYGSVPRGNATVGFSDLDVSVILTTPVSQHEMQIFSKLSASIPKAYPQVSKLDIDPGYLHRVLELQEKYHWQFWLKHCCCCIWGNDLSKGFMPHKPSPEIAYALNGDLAVFLDQMRVRFSQMSEKAVAKTIGKKLIRAAYYFVACKDGSWYTSLPECVEVAKKHYTSQHKDIDLAYQCAIGKITSKTDAIVLYQRLSQRIISLQGRV